VLWPRLDALDAAIAAQDVEGALALLAELVPEWQRGDGVKGAAAEVTAPVENNS
jgi:tRNA(Ile2) C34 agmatinyltransferase TiaS